VSPIAEKINPIKKEYQRMTVLIPSELHHAFKVAAAMQRKRMTDVILESVRDFVKKYAPAAAQPKKGGRA
jgi:hypothetical protein